MPESLCRFLRRERHILADAISRLAFQLLKDALPAKAIASALGHGPKRAVDRRPWSRRSLCSAKSLDDQDWSANFWNEWQLSGT